MSIWQFAVVTVHVFSAVIWIGGAIFLALVMVPVARGMEPPHMGLLFLRRAPLRFRGIAWVLLGLLVVSGVLPGSRSLVLYETQPASSRSTPNWLCLQASTN